MRKRFAELQRIDNDRPITRDTDFAFLHQLQNALLLALKEQGRLNTTQYRYGEEKLKKQLRELSRQKRVSE